MVIYRSLKYQVYKSKTEVKSSDLKRINVTRGIEKTTFFKRKNRVEVGEGKKNAVAKNR